MQSPPWSLIAAIRPAALGALRVVSTTKKPSPANFWAMAPPMPQRTPTGRALSSTALPWISRVLRPSACHFDVAPITTATGLPLLFSAILDCPLSKVTALLALFGRLLRHAEILSLLLSDVT